MAVHGDGGPEPAVPVGGPFRAAPLGELGVPQHLGRLADQGEMVDQDGREVGVNLAEPALGLGHPGRAPGFPARVRIGMEPELVVAHHARLVGAGQGLLLGGRARRPERVVVQHEQRGDHGGATGAVPQRIRILRGQDAQPPAELDEVLVPVHAATLNGIGGCGPQLVVARSPQHGGEPLAQQPQRPLDVLHQLPDITGDNQPVVRRRRPDLGDEGAVVRVGNMQVAGRVEDRLGAATACAHLRPG